MTWFQDHGLQGPFQSPVAAALVYLSIFAPALAVLLLTARGGPMGATFTLLRRLVAWCVGVWPYVVALNYIVVVKLAAAVVYRMIDGSWPALGQQPILLLLAAAVGSTLLGGQVGEELGWRGYALPRMAERWGLGVAGLVLGVIWAFWHLPLSCCAGREHPGAVLPTLPDPGDWPVGCGGMGVRTGVPGAARW